MAKASDNYFTGDTGYATVNGTNVNVVGWNCEPNAERQDATTTRTGGYGAVITGLKRATFTLTLLWDAAANPMDDPPNLKPGGSLTNVRLYLQGLSSPYFSFPYAKVLTTPVTSKVGEATTITVNCESDGTYSTPTGNFSPA